MNAPVAKDDNHITRFSFAHKVFSLEGSYFELSNDGQGAVFRLPMGENMAAVTVRSLRHEFGIENDSADGRLLDLVADGLKYVKVIRVDDAIPRELLDGSASWSVGKLHRRVAKDRLSVQLVTWLAGKEEAVVDREHLEMMVAQAPVKERVMDALGTVAGKIGGDRQEVVTRIERLAHELAYIEALRDHFMHVVRIASKVSEMEKLSPKGSRFREETQRVRALLQPVVADFAMSFDLLDAQMCEIVTVLRNYDTLVALIRETRDDLHARFMIWDEILPPWDALDREGLPDDIEARRDAAAGLMRKTYRFLARNYSQEQTWS